MAELAIPLIGLASAYLLSNQKKNGGPKPLAASSGSAAATVTEGYVNMGKPVNSMPNVSVPPDNYPVFKPKTGYDANEYSNFPNPNAATDKYYDQSVYEEVANGGPDFGGKTQFGDAYQQRRQVMSLTGKPIDAAEFKHNNMAPFFRRQNTWSHHRRQRARVGVGHIERHWITVGQQNGGCTAVQTARELQLRVRHAKHERLHAVAPNAVQQNVQREAVGGGACGAGSGQGLHRRRQRRLQFRHGCA